MSRLPSLASVTPGVLVLKDIIKISSLDFYCAWRPGDKGHAAGQCDHDREDQSETGLTSEP